MECLHKSEAVTSDIELVRAALARTQTPALGGIAINREGILYLAVEGVRRIDRPKLVTPTDPWHLGSNTKAMTAATYARLVQKGDARWAYTIGHFFPHLKKFPLASLTISDLVQHRSGLSDEIVNPSWLAMAHSDARAPTKQRGEMVERIIMGMGDTVIGRFRYANVNYVIIGAAIERITEGSWEEATHQQVFGPLGLTSASFGAPLRSAPRGHRDNIPIHARAPNDNPPVLAPAGSIHMSLVDYGTFLRVFLRGGGGFLDSNLVIDVTRPQAMVANPDYQFGWQRYCSHRWGGTVLAHEGSNTLWHALSVIVPKAGIAVAAVSNDGIRGVGATRWLAERLLEKFVRFPQDCNQTQLCKSDRAASTGLLTDAGQVSH